MCIYAHIINAHTYKFFAISKESKRELKKNDDDDNTKYKIK
jgi:hypothetical protein